MKYVLPAAITLYIFSLLGELGSFWWAFDLLSHWRSLYLLAGLLLTLLAVLVREWKWAFTASIIMVYHLLIVAAFVQVFPPGLPVRAAEDVVVAQHTVSDPQQLTVAFANTYWKNTDISQVVNGVSAMRPDVIFLEEIQPDQFETVRAQLPEYTFAFHAPVELAFDMGVLSKIPVKANTVHFFLPEVPMIEVVVESNGKELHLLGVHPHSPVSAEFAQARNQYLQALFEYVDGSQNSIVMGGDFNITQFSPVYRELMHETRMVDTQSNFRLTSTWPSKMPSWAAIPIDQVFVTPDVTVSQRYRGEFTGSDHWPIVVRVGL